MIDRKSDCEPETAGSQSSKWQATEAPDAQAAPTDSLMGHPGPKIKPEEIERSDLSWKDVGSGTMARTFLGATKLQVSTRGGPQAEDVYRRTAWNLATGGIIDDCIVEDTPDANLFRSLPAAVDIRVEFVMKDLEDL